MLGRAGTGAALHTSLQPILVVILLLHHLVNGHDTVHHVPHRDAARLFVLLLSPADEPPVEQEDEEGECLNAGTDAHVLVAKELDVVHEAAAALGSLAGLLPHQAGRVDNVAEHDRAGNVAKQPEYHKLNAESKSLLLLLDAA